MKTKGFPYLLLTGAFQIVAVGQATNSGEVPLPGRLTGNYNKFQCDNLKCITPDPAYYRFTTKL